MRLRSAVLAAGAVLLLLAGTTFAQRVRIRTSTHSSWSYSKPSWSYSNPSSSYIKPLHADPIRVRPNLHQELLKSLYPNSGIYLPDRRPLLGGLPDSSLHWRLRGLGPVQLDLEQMKLREQVESLRGLGMSDARLRLILSNPEYRHLLAGYAERLRSSSRGGLLGETSLARAEQQRREREANQRQVIETKLTTDPLAGLTELAKNHQLWSSVQATRLGEAAVEQIRRESATTTDPLGFLDQVRYTRSSVESAWRTTRNSVAAELLGLETRLEARCLALGLSQAAALAELGDWAVAAKVSNKYRVSLYQSTDGRKALEAFSSVAGELEAVTRLETALALPGAEGIKALAAVPTDNLSEGLRKPLHGLRGVAHLQERLARRWDVATEVKSPSQFRRLRQSAQTPSVVEQLGRDAADLRTATGDDALAARALRELAAQAFLDGDPGRARELLRQEESLGQLGSRPAPDAAQAAAMLRDMKALVLGEGSVSTEPARRALTPRPDEGGDGNRGPPAGVRFLIPEGEREGWRPPVAESALGGLPPLREALAAHIEPLRRAAETHAKTERAKAEHHKTTALATARAHARPTNQPQ
jgi:hypothetical protein